MRGEILSFGKLSIALVLVSRCGSCRKSFPLGKCFAGSLDGGLLGIAVDMEALRGCAPWWFLMGTVSIGEALRGESR